MRDMKDVNEGEASDISGSTALLLLPHRRRRRRNLPRRRGEAGRQTGRGEPFD